jgi:hypothetical protein
MKIFDHNGLQLKASFFKAGMVLLAFKILIVFGRALWPLAMRRVLALSIGMMVSPKP